MFGCLVGVVYLVYWFCTLIADVCFGLGWLI